MAQTISYEMTQSNSQFRLFVSHRHKDNEKVRQLVRDLENSGAWVWVDLQEIKWESFAKHVNEGLAQSNWCIVVLSPAALQSQYVVDEVNAAYQLVKENRMEAVIPFVTEHCDARDIPPVWNIWHRYDAVKEGYTEAFQALSSAIGLI